MSKWEWTLIAAFGFTLVAVTFAGKLGIGGESFETAKYVCLGAFGVFVGKKIGVDQ